MKKITLAMFLMLSSLWAKPTIEFEESVKLHLFGQDFDVPEALINEHTAEVEYNKCSGDWSRQNSVTGIGCIFKEPYVSSCDVKFAKKYILTNLKFKTKLFDKMLKNEKEVQNAFNGDREKLYAIITGKTREVYAITDFKLRANVDEEPIIKTYSKKLVDSYEVTVKDPFGNVPIKNFNLAVLGVAQHFSGISGCPYAIDAILNITALDPSNINTIFAITDHVLKNRDNKYKNEDLLQNIKAQNDELFQKLQENKAQYQVPENSILLKKQNEQNEQEEQVPLEKLQISNEQVEFKNQESQEKKEVIDFAGQENKTGE